MFLPCYLWIREENASNPGNEEKKRSIKRGDKKPKQPEANNHPAADRFLFAVVDGHVDFVRQDETSRPEKYEGNGQDGLQSLER